MFKKFKKKGYYFIIDAFIGSTIIFLSLMIILNQGVRPTKIQYNYEMAEDYSTFIFSTKISDVQNNPYVEGLILAKHINDTSVTIMDQVNLFYYRNNAADSTRARLMIENLTETLIPEKYSYTYNIIDSTRTPSTTIISNRTNIDIKEARVVIASKKITFLQINSTHMFGPATTEIKIWI